MKSLLVLAFSLCWLLAARAEQTEFTLVNKTGFDIAEVYVAPAGAEQWEDDVLGDSSLDDGEEATIRFDRKETAEKWDLRIVDEDGKTIVWKSLNLLKIKKLTLFYRGRKATSEAEEKTPVQ